jgi:DNA (cytosine-5)-methyltransferase 1
LLNGLLTFAKVAPVRKIREYLTVGQAAELLGVSPWTLRYWDRTGKLTPTRHPLSGYRLYRREQLDELLEQATGGRCPEDPPSDPKNSTTQAAPAPAKP